MFLIPGIVALFTFVYVRPQEVVELLRPVGVATVLAIMAFGWVLDVRLGTARVRRSPLLVLSIIVFTHCFLTLAIKAPDRLTAQTVGLVTPLLAFMFVSQGLQSLRALGVAAAALLAVTLFVSAIAVDQGTTPSICYYFADINDVGVAEGGEILEGRPCNTAQDCRDGGTPGKEYFCERPGAFGTHSITKRVRYRGLLEDPNELSWAVAMALPLAFAFYELRRTKTRMAMLVVSIVVGSVCVVMSQSRSGQMSIAAVVAVALVRRVGWRGAVVGALVTLPVILFGGRTGQDAESSTQERLECWSEALQMWRENPLFGVGQGQFTEHHYLTAHNSFMLTLAELGPVGLVLWSAVIYLAFKITIRAQIDLKSLPAAVPARIWAGALFSSMVGMLVSAFFLSLAYNPILWIFIGMVGALEAAVQSHLPDWRVRFGFRDLFLIAATDATLVVAIAIYLRIKGV